MYRRVILIARLLFVFISFASSASPQAVVPNPADIAPVINPPNPQTNIVLSLANFMTGGVSTYRAFKNALDACRLQHAAKLTIPTGHYVFDDPNILQDGAHIGLYNLSDLIIDGQGSEFVFHFPKVGFVAGGSNRIIIRNLIVDTDLPLASLGVVQKAGGSTNIRILDAYPVNSSTPVYAISPYDIGNMKWRATPGEVFDPVNVTLAAPQTFTSPSFNSLTDGEEVVVRHYGYQGHAFYLASGVSDFAFEDITIYGCPGMAFTGGDVLRGVRLSHCRIMQKPGTNRPVSATADGAHFTNTFGDILIEDCDFSGQGDDSVNIGGLYLPVTQKVDARTVVLTRVAAPGLVRQGSVLRFVKPGTLEEYARLNATQVAYDGSNGNYTVTVDQDLPANLDINDLVINLTQSNHRFLVTRNYFHDHRARGILIQSQDGVVENNRVKNTTMQGIDIFADAAYFREGPGAENVIVRNNTFEGCGYGNYGTAAHTMGCVNITANVPQGLTSAPVNKNVLFDGNTVADTPGLAIFISSASGITISNNVIINSNTLGAFPPWYGSAIGLVPHGSIMVTKASNVLLTDNLQLVNAQQQETGIYVDPQTTTGITVQSFTVTEAAPTWEGVVLTAGETDIKTWTTGGRTYAYLKLLFPNAGYRVANFGLATRAGNDFTGDAAVEKFSGASVQAVTTTAGIYDLGTLTPGSYNFTFKNSGTVVKTQAFTVAAPPFPANPIDTAREFVKQQYRDFLNREADQAGEDFWTDNITLCSDPARRPLIGQTRQTEAECTLRQRETTSGAFFLSPEFQYTGYYVYRMYQGALGRQPKLSEFTPDAQFVGAGILVNSQLSAAKINQNKADFAQQFVNCTDATKSRCAEFKAIYDGLNNQQYVDKLFETTGVNASPSERSALVNGLNASPPTETRASVLQKVVDGIVVISEGNQQFTTTYGQAFYNSESNRAFVLLEYFGYMKRDPDDAGYAFWLGKLNQFNGNFVNAEMVLAFISSPEYRARFGQP